MPPPQPWQLRVISLGWGPGVPATDSLSPGWAPRTLIAEVSSGQDSRVLEDVEHLLLVCF